ncbi:pyridoxamine kinase [Clostridium sp.]|uniref:pyridoxamine kinase n=1 Tax=Clostridium sp. TaxID=1506 RepID=UPI00261CFAC7|nr:pyridoxamine kinase [Clostridium sp.]
MKGIKKVAAINDLSGVGRCSLTVAIPILSVLGVECCPFPTAILSCQTAFKGYTFLDMTDKMDEYKSSWDRLNFKFDCIYSGFLGSEEQIETVIDMVKDHKEALIVIDPVMGDNGIIYNTYTSKMCKEMRRLVSYADIITPNITEAYLLADRTYNKEKVNREEILEIAKEISKMGPKKIIITGIVINDKIYTFSYDKEVEQSFFVSSDFIKRSYGGTGDIFVSILIGLLLNSYSLKYSIEKAMEFIYKAINYTIKEDRDPKEGIIFEKFLKELILINEN